jgi:hypothetical protein
VGAVGIGLAVCGAGQLQGQDTAGDMVNVACMLLIATLQSTRSANTIFHFQLLALHG